jgi:hypothetical protein
MKSVNVVADMTAPPDYWVATVPGLRTVSESNARDHWATKAKRAKKQRATVALVCRSQIGNPPALPLVVTLTRISRGTLDAHDNLRSALKACADGVTDWLGLASDRHAGLTFEYAQERAKGYGLRVEIRRAP